MFRRCISLLVIMGLVAGQLAMVPHAHAGFSAVEQQKHDAAPHFHSDLLSHNHHEHGRPDGGHHDARATTPASDSPHETPPEGLNETGHDAMAVYVPGNAISASTGRLLVSNPSLLADQVDFGVWPLRRELVLSVRPLERGRPPGRVLGDSDIYLTLRNLRI